MLLASPKTFYHFIGHDPPENSDFRSKADKGYVIGEGESAEVADAWDGISAYDTMERARRHIVTTNYRFIATMEITDSSDIRYKRTFAAEGHYTLWGSKEDLRAAVTNVTPV